MKTVVKFCIWTFILIACILIFGVLMTPHIYYPPSPPFPVNFPEWTHGPGIDQYAVAEQRIKEWKPKLNVSVVKCIVLEISKICPFEYFVSSDDKYFNKAMTYVIQHTQCLIWDDNLINHLYSIIIIPNGCKKDKKDIVKAVIANLTPSQFALSDNPQALVSRIINTECPFI